MRSLARTAVSAVALLSLLACTGTKMVTTWRDPKYQPLPVKRVFIACVMSNDQAKVVFENALAKALLDKGYLSATSTGVFVNDPVDKEKITAFVRANQIDLVVVQRMIKHTELAYLPGTLDYVPASAYYGGYWGAYGYGNGFSYTSAYVEEDTTVRTETTVYSTHSSPEVLVWSGASDTFNVQSALGGAQSLAKSLVTDLVKAGILVQ